MAPSSIAALLVGAAVSSACTIPTEPLGNNITYPFRAQVQNATRPEVHNKYMNLYEAGGGDRHLFIGPVGVPTYDLTLVNGVINHVPNGVRAVIGGEVGCLEAPACTQQIPGELVKLTSFTVLRNRPYHQDVHDWPG